MNKFLKSFITAIVFTDFVGVSMAVTIFPSLLLEGNSSLLDVSYSHNLRLSLLGLLIAMYPLGQFFGAALFGKLSDAKGRKPILLITLLGTLLCTLLCGISISYSSLIVLFIGRIFSGFFAGNISVSQASILDISSEQERSSNIGLLQAAMGTGWIIGPVISSFFSNSNLNSYFNESLPFYIVSFILGILFIATVVTFKETNMNKATKVKIRFFDSISGIANSFSNKKLLVLLISWSLFASGWMLFEQFLPTFFKQNFNFSTSEIGYVLAGLGLLYAVSNMIIGKPVNKRVAPNRLVLGSCLISGLAVLLMGFSATSFLALIFASIFCFSCIFTIPGLIVSTSNTGSSKEQGQIMGTINSLQALMTILMTGFGGFFLGNNPKFNAIAGGMFIILSWVIFVLAKFSKKVNPVLFSTETKA